MKIKHLKMFIATFSVSLFGFVALSTAQAFADTCTWTGGGSSDNFNDAANWNSACDADDNGTNNVPQNNDALVFDNSGLSAALPITNDIAGLTVDTITFSGSTSQVISIVGTEAITVANAIVNNAANASLINVPIVITNAATELQTNPGNINLANVVSGSGGIWKTSTGTLYLEGNNTFAGLVDIDAGTVEIRHINGFGNTTGGTTVSDGALVRFNFALGADPGANPSLAEVFSLAGDGTGTYPNNAVLIVNSWTGGESLTLSGDVTLTANTQVVPHKTLKLTGNLSGAFEISVAQGHEGNLLIESATNTSNTENGTSEAPEVTIELTDSQPTTDLFVRYNETVILTGVRQVVTVNNGGILKGTGTVSVLTVNDGGKVAPGLSPGCIINNGNTSFNSGSSLDVEIGGTTACTEYDQIQANGTVDVTGATLNVARFNNFTPATGQTYTIIANDSNDAVTGTFLGLAEGATITIDGYTFTISYVGGDGNDVVLTVTGVPPVAPVAPNTGLGIILANPLLTLIITAASSAGLITAARRYGYVTVRK
jgi:fibronectin-binding autotransporter adhesin